MVAKKEYDEPSIEFIDLRDCIETTVASGGDPVGGGQRCTGTMPEAEVCETWNGAIPF